MSTPHECRRFGRNLILPCPMVEFGGLRVTAAVTLTAKSQRFLQLDATAGGFTLTLPSNPYSDMSFYLSEDGGSGNTITVDGNGYQVNGASTLTMNAAYRQRWLRFNGTRWVIIGGIG